MLKNVIRTNMTDLSITTDTISDESAAATAGGGGEGGGGAAVQYKLGRDYSVKSSPLDSQGNFSSLEPFVVRRLPGGRIPAGAQVNITYVSATARSLLSVGPCCNPQHPKLAASLPCALLSHDKRDH